MIDFVEVIQCDSQVPPGLVADVLGSLSPAWRLVRLDLGESIPETEARRIIVLGGAMSVHDQEQFPFLVPLKRHINERVREGIPFLGICLGGQLLAAALGAEVVENRWGERGSALIKLNGDGQRDPLFRGAGCEFPSFQWHNDSFDLPPEAVLLASTDACPNQAFRFGANVWGIQFHPEVTPEIIAAWVASEGLHPDEADAFVADWRQNEIERRQIISCLIRNFLAD